MQTPMILPATTSKSTIPAIAETTTTIDRLPAIPMLLIHARKPSRTTAAIERNLSFNRDFLLFIKRAAATYIRCISGQDDHGSLRLDNLD